MTIFNSAKSKSLVKDIGDNFNAKFFKKHFNRHFNQNRTHKSRVVYNSNIKHSVNRLISGRDMSYSQYIKGIRGNQVQLGSERNLNEDNNPIVSQCNIKPNQLNVCVNENIKQKDVCINKVAIEISQGKHSINSKHCTGILQITQNDQQQHTVNVLQRDGRPDAQTADDKRNLKDPVSSEGSPGCAHGNKIYDIVPDCDDINFQMRSNGAYCGGTQWVNSETKRGFAFSINAGHKS
jgi:hypothetical protein